MTDDDLTRLRDEVAGVLRQSPLADHIRDARSAEVPCNHWIGQEVAVCAPCVRDRLAPHVADALLPLLGEAWGEGYRLACGDHGCSRHSRDHGQSNANPYRAALAESTQEDQR